MSDDTKVDFYLANRLLIEEWAALRRPAASALDTALLTAVRAPASDMRVPTPVVLEEQSRMVRLHFTREPNVWLELWWQSGNLLRGPTGWPYLALIVNKKNKPLRDVVRDATAGTAEAAGLTSKGNAGSSWLRSGQVGPLSEPIEIGAYAAFCVERMHMTWLGLHEAIVAAVASIAVEQ